jgi:undecaprenyl diphosphate synthase
MTKSPTQDPSLPAERNKCHVAFVLRGEDLFAPDGKAFPGARTLVQDLAEVGAGEGLSHLSVILEDPVDSSLTYDIRELEQEIVIKEKTININVLDKVEKTRRAALKAEALTLSFLPQYDGKEDMISALKKIADKDRDPSTASSCLEEELSKNLAVAGLPDPDLMVYFEGRKKLGNVGVWIGAYSEFAFLDQPWHSFTAEGLRELLNEFGLRERRFGSVASDRS